MNLSSPIRARVLLVCAAVTIVFTLAPTGDALAKHAKSKTEKTQPESSKDKKADAKKKNHDKSSKKEEKSKAPDQGKSKQIGVFGDWGVYSTEGKAKTCYALAQPKTRDPHSMKRGDAYVFISARPAENVKHEISIIMGFSMKDGAEAKAEIGNSEFGLIAKGSDAWIKNPAEEGRLIDAMKKGAKLVVKASNIKGKATVDTYVLSGLAQALDKVRKECR